MSDKVTDAIAEREKAKAKARKPKVEKKPEAKTLSVTVRPFVTRTTIETKPLGREWFRLEDNEVFYPT